MGVTYELKQKRAALIDRLEQIEGSGRTFGKLMNALDRVILSYEPDYQASTLTRPEHGGRSRKVKPSSSEVKAAMGGVTSARPSWRSCARQENRFR